MGVHEHTALAGLVAITAHSLTPLADPWLPPPEPAAPLSFYVRRRIGVRLWRRAHRAGPSV
jgi:hypothetical protein